MIELTADILASLSCAAFHFNEIHIRGLFRGEKSEKYGERYSVFQQLINKDDAGGGLMRCYGD